MFKKFTLKNYKTHKLTTIELGSVTLLIGNNSSGKTNLLSGIQHFANLVRRGNPSRESHPATVIYGDYFPHKHRLADEIEAMSIEVSWSNNQSEVIYILELYPSNDYTNDSQYKSVSCREKIIITIGRTQQEISNGFEEETQVLKLQIDIDTSNVSSQFKAVANHFFRDFSNTFSYHFQPSFLNGNLTLEEIRDRKNPISILNIPDALGYEGKNLERLILAIKEDGATVGIFARFVSLMRRFNSSFQGVHFDIYSKRLIWEFDLGRSGTDRLVEEFTSHAVSDGFIKAAAIALLVSLYDPPALILIEEIENGINPGNIKEIMNWIWQATALEEQSNTPQFVLTTHSPSVLREFHKHLDCVYTTRLKKKGFQSDVRNLSKALDTLIGIGAVEGESFTDPETGKVKVEMPQYQLAELWYSGTIG